MARTARREAGGGAWDRRGGGSRRGWSPGSGDPTPLRRRGFPCFDLDCRGTGRTGRDRRGRTEDVASDQGCGPDACREDERIGLDSAWAEEGNSWTCHSMERSTARIRLIRPIRSAESSFRPLSAAKPREISPSFAARHSRALWGEGTVRFTRDE